jgi:hypothetical protein
VLSHYWFDGLADCAIAMETLRVYRPRLVLHGPFGMGQGYIGAAALHHLEGYHVQTLDMGTLMGDSTRVSLVHHSTKLALNGIIRLWKPPWFSYSSRLKGTSPQ